MSDPAEPPEVADQVASELKFFVGARYELHAWVVMPNHVHLVFRPLPGWTSSSILKSWKGYTAREANKLLQRTGGEFWQTESFDHLVRDDEDAHRCCHYTTMNPVNARLCARPEDWKWSSAYRPPSWRRHSCLRVLGTFQSPVAGDVLGHGTGKFREPAGWKACATTLFNALHGVWLSQGY